jgi:hypothetical protein
MKYISKPSEIGVVKVDDLRDVGRFTTEFGVGIPIKAFADLNAFN